MALPTIVDSHCHLDVAAFAEDRDEVVRRARASGVGRMLTIGMRVTGFDPVLAVAERYEDIWCSVGVHPHEVNSEPEVTAGQLADLADHPKVAGIGESGLDFYYRHGDPDRQTRSFRIHAEAARRIGLPLIVHCRDADDACASLLEEEAAKGGLRGVLHCFTGGAELARRAVAIGFYISFSGIITFRNAADLRAIAASVPADRLLVETDAPFLAPVPRRGRRNEPAFVAHTHAALAALRGLDVPACAALTTGNFHRLFDSIPPVARAGPA